MTKKQKSPCGEQGEVQMSLLFRNDTNPSSPKYQAVRTITLMQPGWEPLGIFYCRKTGDVWVEGQPFLRSIKTYPPQDFHLRRGEYLTDETGVIAIAGQAAVKLTSQFSPKHTLQVAMAIDAAKGEYK